MVENNNQENVSTYMDDINKKKTMNIETTILQESDTYFIIELYFKNSSQRNKKKLLIEKKTLKITETV